MYVEERNVDHQGRISLPSKWRKKHLSENGKVTITQKGDEIIITPLKPGKISDYFDSVEVDLKSDLSDWNKVKKELLTGEAE